MADALASGASVLRDVGFKSPSPTQWRKTPAFRRGFLLAATATARAVSWLAHQSVALNPAILAQQRTLAQACPA